MPLAELLAIVGEVFETWDGTTRLVDQEFVPGITEGSCAATWSAGASSASPASTPKVPNHAGRWTRSPVRVRPRMP